MREGREGDGTAGVFARIRWMQKCANVDFSTWSVMPRTWMVLGVMAVFAMWNLSGVLDYSAEVGIRCTPWVYPHYFSMPIMGLVYGFLTIALFSDAPFRSPFSDFLQIRTGKRTWLLGQCLFVAEASLCYSVTYFLLSVIMVLPRIIVMNQWGRLIETFAYSQDASANLVGVYFVPDILEKYTPAAATLWTILFVWLVSCFMGMLILACRVLFGGNVGSAAAGFLVFLSYFCVYIGSMVFGGGIYRFSPVSWICISVFRGSGGGPDMVYGLSFLILGIVACCTVGSMLYERKEMV